MQPDLPAPASPEEATPIGPARAFVVRTPRKTWAVPLLLVLNGGVFAAMLLAGASWDRPSLAEFLRVAANPSLTEVLSFGACHGPYVAQGDWWRLVSCAFVHIGFLHFLVNMLSLFALRIVESFYGSGAFLLLYLMSAVGASVCSLLWHPSVISAGASGALFGLAGALLAFFVAHRHSIPELFLRPVLRNLILLLLVNILIGAVMDGIDNVAHLGGLAMGLIAGRALDRDPQGSARLDSRRLARASIPAILLGLLCVLVPWRASSAADIRLELASDQAQRELRLGHTEAALVLVEGGLARDPTNPDLLGVRARIRLLEGDPRAALADLDGLLYQRPDDAQARLMRAVLLRALERYEEALEDAVLLVGQNPDDSRYRQLAGELHWCLSRWREAAVEFGVLARRKGESAIEGQLFLFLARCRMGEEDQALRELKHYLATPHFSDDSALDVALGGLFAGETSLEELIARFDRHAAPRSEIVRLYFFAGVWRELAGDPDEARKFLHKSVDGPATADSAWLLARHELERLEKR
jgi:membrane associated rhomboid family serine protease/tetratricopeptide (TPR) repeat protein